MMLTKWKYDNEYNDGLVQDSHGAWYYTAEVDAELAALKAELAQWMGIFGEHDQSLPALDRARTMWDTLKTDGNSYMQAALRRIVELEAADRRHLLINDALGQQLAAVTAERNAFIQGGVTEELLRKQDGHIKLGNGCCIVIEQEWNVMIYQLNVLEPDLTACRARAAAAEVARDNFAAGIESMRAERTALQREYAKVCDERDTFVNDLPKHSVAYQQRIAALELQLTEAIKDRDAWNGDANSHLHALCEKQAEVNGLEQGLAAAYLDVRHYREACASVGETDGHGWAETTKELRQQLAEVAQSCTWSQDGFGEDHYDTSCGRRFSLENGASPLENHMRFCCYCGHPLKEVLETEDPKENQS